MLYLCLFLLLVVSISVNREPDRLWWFDDDVAEETIPYNDDVVFLRLEDVDDEEP